MKNLKLKMLAKLLIMGLLVSSLSLFGKYPDRPLSLMVAYNPGGATDFQARIVTMMSGLDNYIGEAIAVVNRPGAGGQVGWNQFATKARKDGYQLAAYNVPHFIAQSIVFKTKYNINNLEPIANWGADPAVLIVPKSSPFNSVAELISFAKANPGKVTVSGAGLYVGHHIAYLQLEKAAGVDLKYVPGSGGVGAMRLVISGEVGAGFNNLSDSFRNKDRIKILAVADLNRNQEFLPNVPTFLEKGVNVDDTSVNFRGIMVRKGTSSKNISFLSTRAQRMFNDPRVVAKMKEGGSPLRVLSRNQVIKMWQEREVFLRELLKEL